MSTTKIKPTEARAEAVAEQTAIVVTSYRRPGASGARTLTFHLVHPSGSTTLCRRKDWRDWVGFRADVRATTERVCSECVAKTGPAYGERLSATRVVEDFNRVVSGA
jgi:hypothetical protein